MSNWIQTRRKHLGLSQDQVAIKLQLEGVEKVSRSLISHWELGERNPPFDDPEFTEKFAKVLDLSVLQVLENVGFERHSIGYSANAQHAAELIEKMPPSQQNLALGILEQLLKSG